MRGIAEASRKEAQAQLFAAKRAQAPFLDEFERQIDAAMARARESVVTLEYNALDGSAGKRRLASGVAISHRCEILSVRIDPPPGVAGGPDRKGGDPATIVARDYLGRRHPARWLASDPHTGLTLLLVAPRAVRPIRAANDGPKLGGQVFVVGNARQSVSRGHIAGLDRVLEAGKRRLGGLIQVQTPLYPGDSGAAVFDARGAWLGLIRAGLATPGTAGRAAPSTERPTAPEPRSPEHRDDADVAAIAEADRPAEPYTVGLAIPSRDAEWIAEQLRANGRVDRAYLGVHLDPSAVSAAPAAAPSEPTPWTPPAASSSAPAPGGRRGAAAEPGASDPAPADPDEAPVPADGARLLDVLHGTPAAQAGLRGGDRIVTLDGQPIRSSHDLIDRLDRIPARKTIVLGVVREGESGRRRLEISVRSAGAGPSARTDDASPSDG